MNFGGALKWSFISEIASRFIQPVIFVVLAKTLSPDDFGIMAAALMVIAFSEIFSEAGMGQALIQRQDRVEAACNTAFWINLTLALAVAILIVMLAKPVAVNLFKDARVTDVLRVMALHVLLSGACSVHSARLRKNMRFKDLFWARLTTSLAPVLVSVPMALTGYGYWALVAGSLIGQLAQTVLIWKLESWRPTVPRDFSTAKSLFTFGSWATSSAVLAWFFTWGDSLFVGAFLGSHELGLYRFGTVVVSVLFSLLITPITPVAYSHFSRMQQDRIKLQEAALIGSRLTTLLLVPLAGLLLLHHQAIEELLLDPAWEGVGLIIAITAITQAVANTIFLNQEIFRSIGRADVETKIMLISALIRVVFYAALIHFGLLAFMLGRLVATFLGVCNHLFWASRILDLKAERFLKNLLRPLAIATVTLTLAWVVDGIWNQANSKLLYLVSSIGVTLSVYLLMIWIFEKDLRARVTLFIKQGASQEFSS